VSDLDFVKMNSRERKIEPNWFGVAEKVDVVSARRQLRAERRRQNSASADEWKANESDFERPVH
jgi:hypothetical protein